MLAVEGESHTIGEFLEWLQETDGKSIACLEGPGGYERWSPSRESIQTILARYFEINLSIVEDEKRALLRKINEDRERVSGMRFKKEEMNEGICYAQEPYIKCHKGLENGHCSHWQHTIDSACCNCGWTEKLYPYPYGWEGM